MEDHILHQIGPFLYRMSDILGSGAFGKVYKGWRKDFEALPLAIKQINLRLDPTNFERTIFLIEREIKAMKVLVHKNIVSLIEYKMSPNNFYLITELCNEGSLEDRKKKNLPPFTLKQKLTIIKQIVEAMIFVHSKDIIHRDLKPANILLHDGNAKIADFGLARFVGNQGENNLTGGIGTPLYMAPEVFRGEYDDYKFKCDVWSVGMMLYELMFGVLPWKGQTIYQYFQDIGVIPLRFPQNNKVDGLVLELIGRMLDIHPETRIGFNEIINLDLFTVFLPFMDE